MSLKNIRLFLFACKKFDLKDSDLFSPADLFDFTNFGNITVIYLLVLFVLIKLCNRNYCFLNLLHNRQSFKYTFQIVQKSESRKTRN